MKIIEKPLKAWSVQLLAIASAVAGLEAALPQLKEVLPEHWYAIALPLILLARVVSQAVEQDSDAS